jgi:hypothetical protein
VTVTLQYAQTISPFATGLNLAAHACLAQATMAQATTARATMAQAHAENPLDDENHEAGRVSTAKLVAENWIMRLMSPFLCGN